MQLSTTCSLTLTGQGSSHTLLPVWFRIRRILLRPALGCLGLLFRSKLRALSREWTAKRIARFSTGYGGPLAVYSSRNL